MYSMKLTEVKTPKIFVNRSLQRITTLFWPNVITNPVGQYTQDVVSLYWVYCWTIIQQSMLVADNFHMKIQYTNTHSFHWAIHNKPLYHCIGYILSVWTIIQQCMLVVHNFHIKIRYTYYVYKFHIFLKVILVSCCQFM